MTIEPPESAEKFAERILRGMGFDLKLIGDAPLHIASDIKVRDLALTHAAEERMREALIKAAIPLEALRLGGRDSVTLEIYEAIVEATDAIRAIPLSTDAPTGGEK